MPPKRAASPIPPRRTLVVVLGVAVVAAAALVAVALLSQKNDAPAPVETPVANLAGIPQSGRTLGSAKAKVELLEFADQQCPACRYYALSILPALVDEYVRPGKVRMEYHAYPFIGPDSIKGAQFVLAAGLQNRLWQLHEALYRHQGAENSGWLTDDLVRQLAGRIPGLDVDRLFRDASGQKVAAMGNADMRLAQAFGVGGTPTLFVKIGDAAPYELSSATSLDLDRMRAALDDALRG